MARSVVLTALLLICLVAAAALSGCLFGKKDDGGEEAAPPEGGGPAASGMGSEGGGEGGPPAGMKGPGAPPPGMGPRGPGGPPPGGMGEGTEAAPADEGTEAPDMGKVLWQGKYEKAAGNYAQALGLLDQVLATEPSNADALYTKAWILAEQGKAAEAQACFTSFLGVEGSGNRADEAKTALERLKAAAPPGAGGGAGSPGAPPGMGAGPKMPGPPPKGGFTK